VKKTHTQKIIEIMAAQTSQHAQDSIQWNLETSKNGTAYRYGESETAPASDSKPQDQASDDSNPAAKLQSHQATEGGNADVNVTWTVTGDVWKNVDPNLSANVDKYSLHIDHGSPLYDWEIEFHTKTAGKYRFWDSDNPKDFYDCTVKDTGKNHLVDFDSKVPTISRVQYWAP